MITFNYRYNLGYFSISFYYFVFSSNSRAQRYQRQGHGFDSKGMHELEKNSYLELKTLEYISMHKCKISTKDLKYMKYHIHTYRNVVILTYTPRNLLTQEGPVCNVDDPDQKMHMITEEWRTREYNKSNKSVSLQAKSGL